MNEFEAMALAAAVKKARTANPQAAEPQTNVAVQGASGFNEGLANMAGLPVDLMTGAINLGKQGVNAVAGTDFQPISDPAGGSASMRDLMAPTISDVEPQSAAQRYARRVGQEAGAMAIPGGAAIRGAQAPMRIMGMEAASAVGSGVAGQTSQEIAPGNETADLIASMLGGLSPIGATSALRKGPQAPSLDDLRTQQGQAYGAVDASHARLDPAMRDDIIAALKGRADGMEMDQFMHPKANRTLERMETLEASPRIADVEKKRRLIGRDVAGSMDPSESAIGQGMKQEVDDYLARVAEQGNLGADGQETLAQLQTGRELTQRIKKSEMVDEQVAKAERRAASSGTGGNEVNAIRQNIRSLLDNPKKRRSLNGAEVAKMEDIVRGTPISNLARQIGRMSPNTGALPMMAGIGATSAGASMGGPIGAGIGMSGMAIGALAKGGAEWAARRDIDALQSLIRNGGPVPKRGKDKDALRAAIAALLSQSSGRPTGGTQQQ